MPNLHGSWSLSREIGILPAFFKSNDESEKNLRVNISDVKCNFIFSSHLNSLEMTFDLPK